MPGSSAAPNLGFKKIHEQSNKECCKDVSRDDLEIAVRRCRQHARNGVRALRVALPYEARSDRVEFFRLYHSKEPDGEVRFAHRSDGG